MKHLMRLLIISGIALLTGCTTLVGRELSPEQKNMPKEQGVNNHNPIDTLNQLVKAINGGDLDAAVACYEAQATLIVEPGQVATGTKALREALAGFIAMKTTIIPETYKIIQTGDLALYTSKWNATGTASNGTAVKMSGSSSDVLRRQADGRWRIAIDNPYGAAILN